MNPDTARELLECLKALVGEADLGEVDLDDETRATLDRARAAIARAEQPATPAAPATPARKPVCTACGSDQLVIDAAARWDAEAQDWSLAGCHDVITCDDCGLEMYETDWSDATVAEEITQ